jgi:hypothetical protein
MKPYVLIQGSSHAIEEFEQKVISALEMGYVLAGDLLAKTQGTELKLIQPVVLEDDMDEEEDEDEEYEE